MEKLSGMVGQDHAALEKKTTVYLHVDIHGIN